MRAKSTGKPKPRKASLTPLLQKRHRNEIFEAIQAVGLDPRKFDLKDSGTEARIKHTSSTSYFIVSRESSNYIGKSLVGDGLAWPHSPSSWQTLMPRISMWLGEVKRDLETPDLWAEFQREAKLLQDGSNAVTENTLFTAEEQKQIAERLRELAKHVSHTNSFSRAQMQALEEKVDYLVDASGRLGRKDWLNIFFGVILAFLLSVALAPETARTIFITALRAIGLLYPELPLH